MADTLEEVELRPGDVLYLPPGAWHEARARGSSLALTLAYERVTSAAVVRAAVLAKLEGMVELAAPAPAALAGEVTELEVTRELARMRDALQAAMRELDLAELNAAWQRLSSEVRAAGLDRPA